jgi:hypothetical protein
MNHRKQMAIRRRKFFLKFSPSDFNKDVDGKIISRPKGRIAEISENRKETGFITCFDFNTCLGRSRRNKCPVKLG